MFHSSFGLSGTGHILFMTHMLAATVAGVGILFLILWATKTLNKRQLMAWGIGLTAGGIVLCFLTLGGMGLGGNKPGSCSMMHGKACPMMEDKNMMKMNGDGMGMMMHGEMDHEMNAEHDPMAMSMNDMAGMLDGKTGNDFDRAFIEGMIPHHQGAIDMARAALQSAGHAEIKQMAREIISAQQTEIEMMRRWQSDWGYTQ